MRARRCAKRSDRSRCLASQTARPRTYNAEVTTALRKVWAVMDAPAGKGMAPFPPEMIARLRAFGELDVSDEVAAKLGAMSAATIDRRWPGSLSGCRSRAVRAPGPARY